MLQAAIIVTLILFVPLFLFIRTFKLTEASGEVKAISLSDALKSSLVLSCAFGMIVYFVGNWVQSANIPSCSGSINVDSCVDAAEKKYNQ